MIIYLVIAHMDASGRSAYRGDWLTLVGAYTTRKQAEVRARDIRRKYDTAVSIRKIVLDANCKKFLGGYEE